MNYYYLALNLMSLICLGMIGSEWQRIPRSESERRLVMLAGLTTAQAALTVSVSLGWPSWSTVALELLCALFLFGNVAWFDLRGVRAARLAFWGLIAALAAWLAAMLYFDLLAFWELGRMATALLGIALSAWQPRSPRLPRLGSMAALLLGSSLGLFGVVNGGHVFILAAYVLMVAVIYSAITSDLWTYSEELQVVSEEALRRTREQLFLLEASEVIGGVAGLGYMLNRVVRSIALAANANRTIILLLQDEREDAEAGYGRKVASVAAGYDSSQPDLEETRITFNPEDYPLLELTIFHRQQVLLGDEQHPEIDPLFSLWGGSADGPLLMIPLALKEKVLGALIVGNPLHSGKLFDGRDTRLCQSLATQVAVAVDNARLYQRLTDQADELARLLALREREAGQSQAILESIAEGVVVSNVQGQVILVNAAAERILGAPRRELLNRPIGTVYGGFISNEPVEKLATDLSIGKEPLSTFVERGGCSVRGMLSSVRTQDGDWLGLVAVFRDVTKEAEIDRAKKEFILTVSGELRTPLTAIKGYVELLNNSKMNPDSRRYLEIIQANTSRMIDAIENVTFIAGVERDAVQLDLQEVDVAELIEEALDEIAPLATARQLTLKKELAVNLPHLEADRPRLRLVLDNLLSNACRFTMPGGRIAVRAWVQQDVTSRTDNRYMIVAVSDTGVGIPTKEQSRIFERFYRADNPLQMEAGGMGVGLSVVKELVEAHGGRVWVESHVGQGSIFHIALPLGRPSPSPR